MQKVATVNFRPHVSMPRRTVLRAGGAAALGSALLGITAGAGRVAADVGRPLATEIEPIRARDAQWHQHIWDAGFVMKRVTIGDVGFSYAEGPTNGPAVVLLHAQQMDWFSYSRVLPKLSKSFHVFDVDYQGHGRTTTPAGYPMNANRIGTDLASFIERVVAEPAYVTGNSSGGLLTTWLTANRADLVLAALLEDPPMFASEYPRIKKTIADRDFRSSDAAVRKQVDDFLLFWINDNAAFFDKNIGPGSNLALSAAVQAYRTTHPGQPVELGMITDDTIRLFLRGMDHQYDPRFGAAFYNGTWNRGFDHATALRKITRPTLLLHANYSWIDGDILYGAMDKADADRAMSLLPTGVYKRIDAGHVTHLDKPAEFIRIVERFFLDGVG